MLLACLYYCLLCNVSNEKELLLLSAGFVYFNLFV